jgi:hypothetical protein
MPGKIMENRVNHEIPGRREPLKQEAQDMGERSGKPATPFAQSSGLTLLTLLIDLFDAT